MSFEFDRGGAQRSLARTISIVLWILWGLHSSQAANLLRNPGFEEPTTGVPAGWTTWIPFAGATIHVVPESHSGNHSAQIETTNDLTAFLVSQPVAIAPGEQLTLSAWYRTDQMETTTSGSFGIAAGWMDSYKQYMGSATYTTAPLQSNNWQQLTVRATPPPGAAYIAVQLRHRGVSGRTWWDDVELVTFTPLAARFAAPEATCEFGDITVPLVVLERAQNQTTATVNLRTTPGSLQATIRPGNGETTVAASFRVRTRGRQRLRAHVSDDLGRQFTAEWQTEVPPLLVTEPVLPVYSCVEDGAPRIELRAWVHDDQEARARLLLEAEVRRQDQVIAQTSVASPDIENKLQLQLPPAEKLVRGDYVVEIRLSGDGQQLARATEDWHLISRAETQVTLSKNGFPMVHGREVFPLGMYDAIRYSELGSAGFNVTQNFDVAHVRRGKRPDNRRMKRILDESTSAGMRHLFLVTHGPGCRILDEEHLRRLRMFRDHPGVLAWYEEEGVARGDVPLQFVKDFTAQIHALAPERPVVIGDTIDAITRVTDRSNFFPADHMDAGIWWWYPFPIRPGGRPGAYEGEEIGTGLELVPPSFLTLAKTSKPIWVALQAYRKTNGRFASPAEQRAQAYIAAIHGAKGLFWYRGSQDGIQASPEDGHYDDLLKLARELREMSPVFMSDDSSATVTVSTPLVSTRLKITDDGLTLLAVNRDNHTTEVAIRIASPHGMDSPCAAAQEAIVRFEDRKVQVDHGVLRDEFEPYGVHVYMIAR